MISIPSYSQLIAGSLSQARTMEQFEYGMWSLGRNYGRFMKATSMCFVLGHHAQETRRLVDWIRASVVLSLDSDHHSLTLSGHQDWVRATAISNGGN
jgi:hypothetical protein